jgi:DNA-3-methyladenine glycosylase II
MKKRPKPLTDSSFAQALRYLSSRDADLEAILENFGPPPMWARDEGFHSLIHIILEQQVSLASARAAYDRLLAVADPLTPERFLQLADDQLKSAGFSRQKTSYCRNLAKAIVEGKLDMAALGSMDDETARSALMQVKGIGRWTADIYLLMVLGRGDIWPKGDLALEAAVQGIKRLAMRPKPEEMERISEDWRPWRAVAARMLWHYYLSKKGRDTAQKE